MAFQGTIGSNPNQVELPVPSHERSDVSNQAPVVLDQNVLNSALHLASGAQKTAPLRKKTDVFKCRFAQDPSDHRLYASWRVCLGKGLLHQCRSC